MEHDTDTMLVIADHPFLLRFALKTEFFRKVTLAVLQSQPRSPKPFLNGRNLADTSHSQIHLTRSSLRRHPRRLTARNRQSRSRQSRIERRTMVEGGKDRGLIPSIPNQLASLINLNSEIDGRPLTHPRDKNRYISPFVIHLRLDSGKTSHGL
jgi:hypothetical protein